MLLNKNKNTVFRTALIGLLGAKRVFEDRERVEQFSQDYHWFSPILEKELQGCQADWVVKPHTQEELVSIVRLAYEHKIPITPRGKGTGNYGQAVPLQRGLVLDTSGLKRVIQVSEGVIHAEAGANFIHLESAARASGQELAMFPSTFQSCLGGFIGGGAGGTGSVEHGFVFDGYVLALKILPCSAEAEAFWVEGEATVPYVHAYGTTGIILEAKVRLVPAREWTALFSTFESAAWGCSCATALDLIQTEIKPRLVSFEQPAFIPYFPNNNWLKIGKINLRAMISQSELEGAQRLIKDAGGVVIGSDSKRKTLDLLSLLSYNHPTLWVKNKRRDFCHLQISGRPLLEQIDAVNACLPDSILHCEARWMKGQPVLGGVLLSRFIDEATLYAGMEKLKSLGCFVMNVHTCQLGTDHLPTLEDLHKYSDLNDPQGLLNPGKIPHPKIAY